MGYTLFTNTENVDLASIQSCEVADLVALGTCCLKLLVPDMDEKLNNTLKVELLTLLEQIEPVVVTLCW